MAGPVEAGNATIECWREGAIDRSAGGRWTGVGAGAPVGAVSEYEG